MSDQYSDLLSGAITTTNYNGTNTSSISSESAIQSLMNEIQRLSKEVEDSKREIDILRNEVDRANYGYYPTFGIVVSPGTEMYVALPPGKKCVTIVDQYTQTVIYPKIKYDASGSAVYISHNKPVSVNMTIFFS